ncbi:fibronectin type III domain-containing protein [Cohnella sp. CBP 2801]|uniref:Fibronectin type III domain-containing protein n=2 Tax=Cohnella zeiphila TaxID=2761120 RepID=A0A7X0VU75_9BACL|nr:fibronectin type III domain-containing protein [Cohnella zeiphila]MBB6730090.1 fibronectin type III domain-containing protein [Cohnella zeiphila]
MSSGTLKDRINQVYSEPVGSPAVDFILEYKLKRSAASDKPVAKDIYAQIQFGNFDNNLVPRFPVAATSITGTAAYLNASGDLETVNDSDIAGYRFSIVPNGGQRIISTVELGFSVRVDTGGTDEAYTIDDLAVYEVGTVQDSEPPSAPTGLTVAGQTDTSVSLSWTAATDNQAVTAYDVYRDGTLAATASGTSTTADVVGLSPSTTYHFAVKAKDGAGNASNPSNEATATTDPSPGGLPAPFGDRDIGSVGISGSASYDEDTGTYSVTGSGADIWGTEDAFHYAYRPWTGYGQIVAHVDSVENAAEWTKAGIMIRASMDKQSPYAFAALTPGHGTVFQDRLQAGGASTLTTGSTTTAPYWLRLVRDQTGISAYDSFDGTNWTLLKRETINLPDTIYVGLAVTSHTNTRQATAAFDQVSVGEAPPIESTYAPFPGTIETRKAWLWNKVKTMQEESGPLNITEYVAQILDGQNVAANLQKLDAMYQSYDYEQYKTVAKMYAYLMVGDQFGSTMMDHVRQYFASYAYAELPQTENLRMSNYTAGYLVGQYFPDLADLNGNSGATLKSMNKANIEAMIDAGVHKGWAEYESPEYTFMTYLCLNAIYQYSDEQDLRQEAKMAMDVMWFEWANDWIDGYPISSESRAKGDSVAATDPTWRGQNHTALEWAYFGSHRAQQTVGESDSSSPSLYRPNLEYLGFVLYGGMSYQPPEMAIRIGQNTAKDYESRKTNQQNSSGRTMNIYRQAYVKPTWGLATEVQYNRVDNWLEDLPVVLRWHSDAPNPLFRLSTDQGTAPIGNYDQPESHRIMQDGKAAVGVFKLENSPDYDYINAMFPDTGSIVAKEEQGGWVFSDAGPMYFAFKFVKPATWYHQSDTDPSNKVKTTAQLHPTAQLLYSYNILRSQADKNGWVLETADASEYASLAAFESAVLANTSLDASHIDETNPRLIYHSLSGDTMDITYDSAAGAYNNTHKIDNVPIDYSSFKIFDTPWLQQDRNSDIFTATEGDEQLVYNFADWTIAEHEPGTDPDPGTNPDPEPLFADDFTGGLGHWDLFGSTAWQTSGTGTAAELSGATNLTYPQRAVVKTSSLPYGSQDYSLEYGAKGDRFRTMFRYSSSTSYYFLEFKNASTVELWKYPNSSTAVQAGTTVNIADALPGFSLADWHNYKLQVQGDTFALSVDGTPAATFTDGDLTAGGIGFALKSVGPDVAMHVRHLTVNPLS